MSDLLTIANAFWDLRDHAYDHPELWRTISAEAVFQALAEAAERARAAGDDLEWPALRQTLIDGLLPAGGSPV